MISENSASFKSVLAPQQSPDLMLICLTFYQERINCLDNLKKGNTDLNFEKNDTLLIFVFLEDSNHIYLELLRVSYYCCSTFTLQKAYAVCCRATAVLFLWLCVSTIYSLICNKVIQV